MCPVAPGAKVAYSNRARRVPRGEWRIRAHRTPSSHCEPSQRAATLRAAVNVSDAIAVAAVVVAAVTWLDNRRYTRAQVQAQRQASLYAERGEIKWDPVEYHFTIGNGGQAVAREIRLWLSAGASTVGTDAPVAPLLPGEYRAITMTMGRPLAHTEGTRTRAVLRAAWTDEAGEHEEPLLSDLPSGP